MSPINKFPKLSNQHPKLKFSGHFLTDISKRDIFGALYSVGVALQNAIQRLILAHLLAILAAIIV